MSKSQTSFFYKAYDPVLQAVIIFGAGIVVTILSKLVNWIGLIEVGERFPWMSAAAFLLFFAVFNSIFCLSSKDMNKYWGRSMLSFVALAFSSGLMAWWFSSIPIGEAGSYKWIFVVVGIGFLVFLSMVGFMKRIVEFAEKEDWQAPRKKNRGR